MWLAFFDEENMSTYYSEVKRLAETNSWIDGTYYQLQSMNQISQVFKGDSNEGLFEIAQNITTGEILHYIDDNYGNDLTLPGLAKKFGLSESGLSKKIKAFTNMTFKEYLTKTRIEAAKSLLISSEKSITEIAVLCGYNSSNFFGDVFKKNMGMSPSSYKKMLTMN